MRSATNIIGIALLAAASIVSASSAQEVEYDLLVPYSADAMAPYVVGAQSGSRGINGPYDLDNDGLYEVLVTDYTGGGRIHVVENVSQNVWEHVYSTPYNDATSTSTNGRAVVGADLDGDGAGEIVLFSGAAHAATTWAPSGTSAIAVYEFTGTDNDYGTVPATVLDITSPTGASVNGVAEQFAAADVDGDGRQELLLTSNQSGSSNDYFFIYSVAGTFEPNSGGGFETWVNELTLARGATASDNGLFNIDEVGGGSPYAIHPADLDGDGTPELSLHAWNSYNFFNIDVVAADTYLTPDTGQPNPNLQASATDNVSLFAGVVVDIDNNGDDEVFYPEFQTGAVSVLNYESGENARQVRPDNLRYQLLTEFSGLGITAGDLDADGRIELIGTGPAHSAGRYDMGEGPFWFRTAEFQGGDVEDPNNYIVEDVEFAFERSESRFDRIERDDQGTMSVYHEDPGGNPEFASKFVYLGDADMDGINEVAFGIQGVADQTAVISEVFNPSTNLFDRTTISTTENDGRVFMKITSCPTGQGKALNVCGLAVDVDEERIVLPSDYKLFDNYPNPFNPSTTIGFELPLDKNVTVRIYDVSGRLVRTLVSNQFLSAGTHEVTWDGRSDAGITVASGTYIYALEYGNFRQAKEMVLVK